MLRRPRTRKSGLDLGSFLDRLRSTVTSTGAIVTDKEHVLERLSKAENNIKEKGTTLTRLLDEIALLKEQLAENDRIVNNLSQQAASSNTTSWEKDQRMGDLQERIAQLRYSQASSIKALQKGALMREAAIRDIVSMLIAATADEEIQGPLEQASHQAFTKLEKVSETCRNANRANVTNSNLALSKLHDFLVQCGENRERPILKGDAALPGQDAADVYSEGVINDFVSQEIHDIEQRIAEADDTVRRLEVTDASLAGVDDFLTTCTSSQNAITEAKGV
ncbi:hypothetical protein HDU85_005047 [Gaertneriomyces sp. JEL0708]|nr:hypothetical protein HDU85_005047 [Gaertneriomyces sp. JEL0708]